jgi:hypothetical protein
LHQSDEFFRSALLKASDLKEYPMKYATFGLMLLMAGCSEPELTAEDAKAAMIELLRTTQLDYMRGFPVDEAAKEPVHVYESGSAAWADFSFDLKTKKYSYRVERGDRNAKDHFAAGYEGTFEYKQGKWVALKPRMTYIT